MADADVERGRRLESQGDLVGAEAAYRLAAERGDSAGALSLGVLLRKRGDLAGARTYYRRAEFLGMPAAACNLAVILEEQGDLAGAEAAYRRADAAGFPGGSFGLGQLLYARQDIAGAITALRRCDQLGDAEGSFNLGVLLRDTGDRAGAEAAFRRAGERGYTPGWSAHGRLLEERGEVAAAEVAYRKGDDAESAFNLASLLLAQERVGEATAAMRRAADLGHEAAPQILEKMDEQYGGGVPAVLGEVVSGITRELTAQRDRVAAAWAAYQPVKEALAGDLDRLHEAIVEQTNKVTQLLARHRSFSFKVPKLTLPRQVILVDRQSYRMVDPDLLRTMEQALRVAGTNLTAARQKFFHGKELNAATEQLGMHAALLTQMNEEHADLQRQLDAVEATRPRIDALRAEAQALIAVAAHRAAEVERQLPASLLPWSDSVWADGDWREQPVGVGAAHLYLGRRRPTRDQRLGAHADLGVEQTLPYALTPRQNLHFAHVAAQRADVHALARSVLLRALLAAEPGNARLTFFDPIGLGQSAGALLELAEYDPELIGGKVWSSAGDLQQRLADHTSHIELVIQKYLRSTYATIDDYNAAAGEVAEPYRYLVVFDFPSGFTEETTRELVRILENGPRCGVRVLLMTNQEVDVPYGVDVRAVAAQAAPIGPTGALLVDGVETVLEMETDQAAPPRLIHEIVDHVGRRATSRREAVVTFDGVFALFRDAALRGITAGVPQPAATVDPAAPQTWWPGSSAEAIAAPIGRSGAREVAVLSFDSGNHAGALLVGRPGSGKSTLLHSYLAGLTTLYSPAELELYLIDFKEGVEFQGYAREGLPHARVVAIESDREFGLSVLQSLEAELKRRGELLRLSGGRHSGLTALRQATGEVIPRVLLVFDEFHVLFARNDKVGLAAAALLETLVRQGRSFGIHVLLGSQSLSGLDALGSHVPQLLPTRILLPATEADGRKVLGEGNDAGQYLTKHGEGILNTAGGAVEANQRFRGSFATEEERQARVIQLRRMADAAGFVRRPVVFEGNAATPIESVLPRQFREELATSGRAPLRLRVGSPMTINGTADLQLSREPGANVLVVAREDEAADPLPRSLLAVAAASLAVSPATIDIVDFTSIDDGVDVTLGPLLDRERVQVHRRRGFARLLTELRAAVRDRIATDDVSSPPRALLLYGVHRARDLDVSGGLDGDPELLDSIEEIVRDGPEVGVHTWMWCETVGGLGRRLPSSVLREFSWRVSGRQSPDDSQRLLGSEAAAELRDRQILLTNDDRGVSRRCTAYTVPAGAWLTGLLEETR